ncbi:putative RNA-directed DNA polymerase, eukaryota, reverse transcriptase zinc-binding domain protein [Tanacetum coccineum]|uniref:RNA-directed DNA polymerase, eukaryota, reverse transcriptase zinc-binding domain protein n=1 Tax=Tanacetum coccineum TaxID=301880 RepID=A0ABQ4YYP3_9ASTR
MLAPSGGGLILYQACGNLYAMTGLIDLPIGGRLCTWMNKAGTKLSKLDRFLISNDVLEALRDIHITALDRAWSGHNHILFHVNKSNFSATPFKLYNLWLFHESFDDLIKTEWAKLDGNDIGRIIRACLHSSRASVLVNGIPTSEFSIKRGIRQGDPLSPFLFILFMEGLHGALSNAAGLGLIRGVKLESTDIKLSYLIYAYDVIITTDWSACDLTNIIRVLHVFYLALGLRINIHKSNIYGTGVLDYDVSTMASNSGCAPNFFHFTYLRLPIGFIMRGRLTLIKAVLGSLAIYYLSIFKTLKTILNSLKRSHSTFFWGGTHDTKKLAWIKWSNVLASFDKGGLNIGILKAFNLAILKSGVGECCLTGMRFGLKLLRRCMVKRVVSTVKVAVLTDKTLPRKFNIFIWRMILDRLPHRLNLSPRGNDIPTISCPSCNGNVKSSNHIFFECDIAKEVWRLVRNWCDIPFLPFTSYDHWKV